LAIKHVPFHNLHGDAIGIAGLCRRVDNSCQDSHQSSSAWINTQMRLGSCGYCAPIRANDDFGHEKTRPFSCFKKFGDAGVYEFVAAGGQLHELGFAEGGNKDPCRFDSSICFSHAHEIAADRRTFTGGRVERAKFGNVDFSAVPVIANSSQIPTNGSHARLMNANTNYTSWRLY
jgi:hypothetical protein